MLLHLKDHCIETAAREERARLESALLELDESSEGFGQLAEDLELVTGFLESADFQKIRSDRPELSGGCDIHVELTRDLEPGEFVLRVFRTPPADVQ